MASPPWLDRAEYPFGSHFLQVDGGRLHYVDEGRGDPLLLVHGQPTWSFMFRHQVRDLSRSRRCVAPDHIGFGLSEKPAAWSYRIEQHAGNLRALIEHLELERITLVLHDWGGPIGLHYAIRHPENIAALVFLNTWMWSFEDDRGIRLFSRVLGSAAGRWCTRHLDLFASAFMRGAISDRAHWERVRECYRRPFASPAERTGCALFPREILGASPLLRELWQEQPRLGDKPALFVWGMQDRSFREDVLERLAGAFPRHEISRQESVGHYVAEEMGHALGPIIEGFLERHL